MGNFNSDLQEVTLFLGDKQIDNFEVPMKDFEVPAQDFKTPMQSKITKIVVKNRRGQHKRLVKRQKRSKARIREFGSLPARKQKLRKVTHSRVSAKQAMAQLRNYGIPTDHIKITVTYK